jgi:hypothetical protein
VKELDDAGVRYPIKTLLPEVGVGEQTRHMHQRQAVFDQHDQGRGHHVGEVGRFLQGLRPGTPERLQHYRCHIIRVFGLSGHDVAGDNIICAGRINLDQAVADVGVGEETLGDQQPYQVIDQEGLGIDQAATAASGDVLIQAPL